MQLSRMAASSGPFGANSKEGFMGEDEGKILTNKIPKGLVNISEINGCFLLTLDTSFLFWTF